MAGSSRSRRPQDQRSITRASSVRERTPRRAKMLRRWWSTVRGLTESRRAISRLVAPSATQRAIRCCWG